MLKAAINIKHVKMFPSLFLEKLAKTKEMKITIYKKMIELEKDAKTVNVTTNKTKQWGEKKRLLLRYKNPSKMSFTALINEWRMPLNLLTSLNP